MKGKKKKGQARSKKVMSKKAQAGPQSNKFPLGS